MDHKVYVPAPARSGPRFATLPHEDHAEVVAILGCYGRFYDDDRIDDFMDLIADDAVFHPNWPGVLPDEISGKAALREFFAGARAACQDVQPRHHSTNLIINAAGPERAEASVGMLYAESKPGAGFEPKMIGQYDYVLEKRNGRWWITRWSMRYDK